MEIPWKPLLFWTPRVLCLLFAVFLSLFALDVFNEGYGFWKTILALFMHLVPTSIVLAVLAISWRWEWAGALSVRLPWHLVSDQHLGTDALVHLRRDLRSTVPGGGHVPHRLDVSNQAGDEMSHETYTE